MEHQDHDFEPDPDFTPDDDFQPDQPAGPSRLGKIARQIAKTSAWDLVAKPALEAYGRAAESTRVPAVTRFKERAQKEIGETAEALGRHVPAPVSAALMTPVAVAADFIPDNAADLALLAGPAVIAGAGRAAKAMKAARAAKTAREAAIAEAATAQARYDRIRTNAKAIANIRGRQMQAARQEAEQALAPARAQQAQATRSEAGQVQAAQAKIIQLEARARSLKAKREELYKGVRGMGRPVSGVVPEPVKKIQRINSELENIAAQIKDILAQRVGHTVRTQAAPRGGSEILLPEELAAKLRQSQQRYAEAVQGYADTLPIARRRQGFSMAQNLEGRLPPVPSRAAPPAPKLAAGAAAIRPENAPGSPRTGDLRLQAVPAQIGTQTPVLAQPGAPRPASSTINLARFEDANAAEVAAELSKDQGFVNDLLAQKRGVVPLEASKAAGQTLIEQGSVSAEKMAALRPGQVPRAGTPDAVMAAAAKIEETALADIGAVADDVAAGRETLEQAADRFARNYRATIGAQGVISEGGRALGAVRRSPLQKAQMRASQLAIRDKLLEDRNRFAAFLEQYRRLPVDALAQRRLTALQVLSPQDRVLAAIREFRGAMLLTNPMTYVRNAVGNTAAVVANLIEKPIARGAGEGVANVYGMWRGFHDGARNALEVLRNEQTLLGTANEFARAPAIPGAAGKAIRIPFRLLRATDEFFSTAIAQGELHAQAYRAASKEGLTGPALWKRVEDLTRNPMPEMLDVALKAAKEFTFQGDLPGALAKLHGVFNAPGYIGTALNFVVPFFKTPVNIMRFLFQRTPGVGLLDRTGSMPEAMAKQVTGLGAIVAASLAMRAKEGFITGRGPKNKVEREALYATGWRPYSIKTGDTWINYSGFEPIATMLRLVAEYQEQSAGKPDAIAAQKAQEAVKVAARGFFDQPFVRSLGDLMEFLEEPDGNRARKFFMGLAASTVPAGVGAAARMVDTTIRDPRSAAQAVQARIPGASLGVPPKLDRFGRPVQRASGPFGIYDRPGPADPVEARLRQLGLTRKVPQAPSQVGERPLTPEQKRQLITAAGPQAYRFLSIVLNNPMFDQMPAMEQQKAIREIVHRTRQAAGEPLRVPAELQALGIQAGQLTPLQQMALREVFADPQYRAAPDPEKTRILQLVLRRIGGAQ